MRKTALIVLLILGMTGLQGVGASGIGIRGGLNFSSMPSGSQFDLGGTRTIEMLPDSYTGYHFGILATLNLGVIFIQPELLYSATGQMMMLTDNEPGVEAIYFSPEFSHLSLPLIAGFKLGPLRVGVGPVFSYMLERSWGHLDDISFTYNDTFAGYQALIGLKIGNLILDFKYEGSLGKFGEGIHVGGQVFEYDNRPNQFILSLGIIIL